MTPKERARLRGLANGIETVLQIGKEGIGDTLIHQADITLEARELIKGRVLDGCMDYTPRTAAETLAAATHSEVVQVIGSKFVLYRRKREAPEKKPLARPERKETSGKRKPEKDGKRPERVQEARKARKTPRNGSASGQHNTASRTPRDGQRNTASRAPRDGQRRTPRDGRRNPKNRK